MVLTVKVIKIKCGLVMGKKKIQQKHGNKYKIMLLLVMMMTMMNIHYTIYMVTKSCIQQ